MGEYIITYSHNKASFVEPTRNPDKILKKGDKEKIEHKSLDNYYSPLLIII